MRIMQVKLPALMAVFVALRTSEMKRRMQTAAIATFVVLTASTVECQAQTAGYPSYGFHSYCNNNRGSYNAGLGGRTTNNSFNTGFSGMRQTSNGMQYSTTRSTNAANQLAQQVSTIWSKVLPAAQLQQMQSMGQPAQMGGMLPPMSKPEMLRTFLEGGTPQSAGGGFAPAPSGASSRATSTAYSNYQTAANEATKARNSAQRVRNYDRDQWSRKNDASRAEYAANNANYAAQRAESAAYSGDSQARGYASQARQAANRARQDANQARYNANTMR